MKLYFFNILIGLDQLANSMLGGNPDVTISGRMGYAIKNGKCKLCTPFCKVLDFVFRQKKHCESAIELDENND